jgi:hypothetical protein
MKIVDIFFFSFSTIKVKCKILIYSIKCQLGKSKARRVGAGEESSRTLDFAQRSCCHFCHFCRCRHQEKRVLWTQKLARISRLSKSL